MKVELPPLPYALDALEPHVSRHTLAVHHGRHHAAYVDKTRKLVENTPLASASLETIVRESHAASQRGLFNAAAQAWNHSFYWSSMSPKGGAEPRGLMAEFINASFGSHAAFRQQFVAAAADVFGSGWTWLVLDGARLRIVSTSNADTPLVTVQTPLLTVDVWEHAYYIDYHNRRADHLNTFMDHLANWNFANSNLAAALESSRRAVAAGGQSA